MPHVHDFKVETIITTRGSEKLGDLPRVVVLGSKPRTTEEHLRSAPCTRWPLGDQDQLPLTLHTFQKTKSAGNPHQSVFRMSIIQGYSLASLLLELLPDMVTHLRLFIMFFFF